MKERKIYIAGHRGLVGSAILKKLVENGYTNLIYKTHLELDLIDQYAVKEFFEKEKPEYVFLCAARLGGIEAHKKYRAEFIYENLQIQNNVIHQAYLNGVKKLIFISSTSVYPEYANLPTKEEELLKGKLQYLHEPYAIAKIAGMKMCEAYSDRYGVDFISVCPTTLYGPNDNFDMLSANVVSALMRRIFLTKLLQDKRYEDIMKDLQVYNDEQMGQKLEIFGIKENRVEIWGSGKPKREFLFSEDLAEACIYIMKNVSFKELYKLDKQNTHINIAPYNNTSIKELAELLKEIIEFKGELYYNLSKSDGTYEKLTSSEKINSLGWHYRGNLKEKLITTFQWYKINKGIK